MIPKILQTPYMEAPLHEKYREAKSNILYFPSIPSININMMTRVITLSSVSLLFISPHYRIVAERAGWEYNRATI